MLAFESIGVTTSYVRPSTLCSVFGMGENKVVTTPGLSRFDVDAVVLRDLGFSHPLELFLRRLNVFKHLEELGTPVVNSVESMITARDKYLSLLRLHSAGLPVPRTAVVEDAHAARRIAEEWGSVVIKPLIGSMGFGSVKADDPDVAFVIARTLQQLSLPIYVQEFIKKPGRDIRVITVGESVVGAMYRIQPSGAWKTNVAQGAEVKRAEVDEELEVLAVRATRLLELHYAGVDIAEHPDRGYVILEVNASPNWRGFMKATGINVAEHIARYVVELARR